MAYTTQRLCGLLRYLPYVSLIAFRGKLGTTCEQRTPHINTAFEFTMETTRQQKTRNQGCIAQHKICLGTESLSSSSFIRIKQEVFGLAVWDREGTFSFRWQVFRHFMTAQLLLWGKQTLSSHMMCIQPRWPTQRQNAFTKTSSISKIPVIKSSMRT